MDARARTALEQFQLHAKRLPGKFSLNGSFGEYVAFLNGLDKGTGGAVLDGFGDWLANRTWRSGRNLVWPELVLREVDIDPAPDGWHTLPPHDEQRAVAALFDLFAEFNAARAASTSASGSETTTN
jgi:hypothetical protein